MNASTAEVPHPEETGSTRVLGAMNAPFQFLYVMLLGGPDAAERARGISSAAGSFALDGFFVISNLTDEVNRPALLVERRPEGDDLHQKINGRTARGARADS